MTSPARRRVRLAIDALYAELHGVRPRLSVALAINRMIPPYCFGRTRVFVLRLGGIRLGARSTVGGRLWIAGGDAPASTIAFGTDCFINDGCRFDTSAMITIEHDVYIGHDVVVITSSHEVGPSSRRAHGSLVAPVEIGAGAWIGARATILPGVRVGRGVVVGAGALVTRSVDDDMLVMGVPARVVRALNPELGPAF